jgi:hypothetical protein
MKLMNELSCCKKMHLCTVCLGLELRTVIMRKPFCNGSSQFEQYVGLES